MVLHNILRFSFGATETLRQSPDSYSINQTDVLVPSSPPAAGIVRFSLKNFVVELLAADRRKVQAQPKGLHNHLSLHAEGVGALESQLKTERERTRQLMQELLTARSALNQIEELQADLEVERETGRLLVQFLEAAERDARKVPVLQQLLRQRDEAGRTVGSTLAGEQPSTQRKKGDALMLLERWKRQPETIKRTRTALQLMALSGAIRRADVEIQFRSSRTIQPMADLTRKHIREGSQG